MGQITLRITIQPADQTISITLEGRLSGPWAAELGRTWNQTASSLKNRDVTIDLRNTTYADAKGIAVLREIYANTKAEFITSTPWTQYLADEVTRQPAV
ncbi:MAG TPA: hypothetical protein VG714_07740 [Acidobacteriaceae bacterium]|nr:hypothetical protein [Acidobacteriaceae bacterium]